ncbi:MAG: hypothetical protein SVU69_03615 [Pseudomonadota bacterium]|nr:hypothetical protein [Pseudomonadota bacterium]
MKKLTKYLGFGMAATFMLPIAANAELQSMSYEDMADVYGQGFVLYVGDNALFDTSDYLSDLNLTVGPVNVSNIYRMIDERFGERLDGAKGNIADSVNTKVFGMVNEAIPGLIDQVVPAELQNLLDFFGYDIGSMIPELSLAYEL